MSIQTSRYSHIRLTVTDIERSRRFYESVFGWPVAAEVPPDADASIRDRFAFLFGGVLYQVGDQIFGLRPAATDRFDEDRVGLDHVSFAVDSLDDLEEAAIMLDQQGVAHGPIKDIGEGFILEFRDPDNIALELMTPKLGGAAPG